MNIQQMKIFYIIMIFMVSDPLYAMSLRDIKVICKRTSNYQRCMKEFTNKKFSKKKEKYTVQKGPVPIKIIPYRER